MNPAEYNSMLWMSQFPPERIVLDENSMMSVGMSVMDEMPHQHHAMDMNTMMMPLSEYNAATATGQIAITPEIFPNIGSHHQLDPQQQTMIEQYNSMMQDHHASDDIIIQEDDDDDDGSGGLVQYSAAQHQQILHISQQQQQQQQQQQHLQHQHQQQQLQMQVQQLHYQQHQQMPQHQQHQLLMADAEDDSMQTYEHHQFIDEDGNVEDLMVEQDGSGLTTSDGVLISGDGIVQIQAYQDDSQSHQHQFDSDNSAHSFMTVVTPSGSGLMQATPVPPQPMIIQMAQPQSQPSAPGQRQRTVAAATKAAGQPQHTNKKIKPVKRPGLVLKTPIAYQPCQDPSVIPIQRDGMAVCERCGAIGVKHSFYTKERRFCSMSCARNELERLSNAHTASQATNSPRPQQQQQQQQQQSQRQHAQSSAVTATATNGGSGGATAAPLRPNYRFKFASESGGGTTLGGDGGTMYKELLPQDELPQVTRNLPSPCPADEKIVSVRRKPSEHHNSYDWLPQLNASGAAFSAAEVTSFAHAPGCDTWYNIGVGMKVEVENTDCDTAQAPSGGNGAGGGGSGGGGGGGSNPLTPHSFWVASVLRICGYKALMRYEGFGDDASRDFWVNLCSSEVHPVGWCAARGKPLIAPRSLSNRFSDWKEFLVSHLSGARTLPTTFYNRIRDSFRSRFRIGLQLEVVDRLKISQVKLATVHKIIGKRLLVKYFDLPPDDPGFWCHEDSSLIHPVGWASTVGHNLSAPMEYLERMAGGPDQLIEAWVDDSIIDLFRMNFTFEEYYIENRPNGFEEGMRLEAVDPLNLSTICVATVMSVLKFGYMMVRIDTYQGSEWFCFHERSTSIFWPGFCAENDIALAPPAGYESATFDWNEYLMQTGGRPADRTLFWREPPPVANTFAVGMKLECADLMDPRLVCVATIAQIVGRLLKVHFDGWEEEYDQWLDCESPDMYPVGWCVLVGHSLEGPKVQPKQPAVAVPRLTGAGAGGNAKAPRKRKKKAPMPKVPAEATDKCSPQTIQTRTVTVKKDREAFDQQRHTHELKQMIGGNRNVHTTAHSVKQEMKFELVDGDDHALSAATAAAVSGGHEVVYDEDGYSYSTTSSHSTPLPISPEPSLTASSIKNPSVLLDQQQLLNVRHVSGSAVQHLQQQQQQQHHQQHKVIQPADPHLNNATAIPRLSDASDATLAALQPIAWSVGEVTQFMRANDCSVHAEVFSRYQIDGSQLLQLSKDSIITMLDMKVGPSLRIFDLIQQLKSKLNPQQARLQKAAGSKKSAYLA